MRCQLDSTLIFVGGVRQIATGRVLPGRATLATGARKAGALHEPSRRAGRGVATDGQLRGTWNAESHAGNAASHRRSNRNRHCGSATASRKNGRPRTEEIKRHPLVTGLSTVTAGCSLPPRAPGSFNTRRVTTACARGASKPAPQRQRCPCGHPPSSRRGARAATGSQVRPETARR
jgi:hypothetical protein